MRNVLILDTETTGLLPAAKCIEVAAILFSVEHGRVTDCFSALIHAPENPAEAVNRIPAALLVSHGWPDEKVWGQVEGMATAADAFLAHQADFDREFAPESLANKLPWICTRSDIAWPLSSKQGQTLVATALDHGLGVAEAHRALADCFLIARLLTRCAELGHDLEAMLRRGLRPKVTLMACVSYEDREKAKAAGFHWNAGRKQWLRRMVEEDAADLGFPVKVVADEERAA